MDFSGLTQLVKDKFRDVFTDGPRIQAIRDHLASTTTGRRLLEGSSAKIVFRDLPHDNWGNYHNDKNLIVINRGVDDLDTLTRVLGHEMRHEEQYKVLPNGNHALVSAIFNIRLLEADAATVEWRILYELDDIKNGVDPDEPDRREYLEKIQRWTFSGWFENTPLVRTYDSNTFYSKIFNPESHPNLDYGDTLDFFKKLHSSAYLDDIEDSMETALSISEKTITEMQNIIGDRLEISSLDDAEKQALTEYYYELDSFRPCETMEDHPSSADETYQMAQRSCCP